MWILLNTDRLENENSAAQPWTCYVTSMALDLEQTGVHCCLTFYGHDSSIYNIYKMDDSVILIHVQPI